jgi:hypothetical protein
MKVLDFSVSITGGGEGNKQPIHINFQNFQPNIKYHIFNVGEAKKTLSAKVLSTFPLKRRVAYK